MKYVRRYKGRNGTDRYMAHLTIGYEDYFSPLRKPKHGIDVSLGTFSSEEEAYNAALEVKELLKEAKTYKEQREITYRYRMQHMDKERRKN